MIFFSRYIFVLCKINHGFILFQVRRDIFMKYNLFQKSLFFPFSIYIYFSFFLIFFFSISPSVLSNCMQKVFMDNYRCQKNRYSCIQVQLIRLNPHSISSVSLFSSLSISSLSLALYICHVPMTHSLSPFSQILSLCPCIFHNNYLLSLSNSLAFCERFANSN